MFLTCLSPEQSNFPPRVDSEPCSPYYTSQSWEGKWQSVISWKDKRVSICHLPDAAETCFLFHYLLGACLGCWTTGGPGERAFFFSAFLAISLCFSVNNNNRGTVYSAGDSNKVLIPVWTSCVPTSVAGNLLCGCVSVLHQVLNIIRGDPTTR